MLQRNMPVAKQIYGYGGIADAFRRKSLKRLEKFVALSECRSSGIYSTNKPRRTERLTASSDPACAPAAICRD
jgi:hypothetical protein